MLNMLGFSKTATQTIWEKFPELHDIPKERFPKHVFIIPDGNGRWAKSKNLPVFKGHQKGFETTLELLRELKQLPIDIVTLWGFSADNWKRPEEEKNALMDIFITAMTKNFVELIENHGRFVHIGRRDRIPEKLRKLFTDSEEKTQDSTGQILCVAIDFAGEDQERRLVAKARELPKDLEVTEDVLWSLRDSGGVVKHADLIIRTSGERRTSDVGWLNGAPTELFFVDKLYPDVTIADIVEGIKEFAKRERRMGGRIK